VRNSDDIFPILRVDLLMALRYAGIYCNQGRFFT